MTTWVAVGGDACDPMTWSGITYHLVLWAQHEGLDIKGLTLHRPSEQARCAWNLWRLLTTGRIGGFQYSNFFLKRLWRYSAKQVHDNTVMNCYQIYPEFVVNDKNIRKWFYIDATLQQVFMDPFSPRLPTAVTEHALDLERRGFEAADGVICHSEWAARSVREDYGIDSSKVFAVVPGANLDPEAYARFRREQNQLNSTGPLRLVFVGRYWERKGLDRLLRAMLLAQAQGADLQLRVIGCRRESLPKKLRDVPGVEWAGNIEKNKKPERFLKAVSWGELGCLLSRSECGGMVLREFASLGMIILSPNVQGSPDHAGPAALLVQREDSDKSIAEKLTVLARRGPEYQRLRATAEESRDKALWSESVRHIQKIIAG